MFVFSCTNETRTHFYLCALCSLQVPSTLTVEDLAAVGVKCDDPAELRYIAEALIAAEPQPETVEELQSYIAVRADEPPKKFDWHLPIRSTH